MKSAFSTLLRQFCVVVTELFRRHPFLLLIVFIGFSAVLWAASWNTLISQGIIALVVVCLSILVYAKTGNFAETSLTFVLGSFAIFQIDWSNGVAWLVFTLILLFVIGVITISSVQIAAKQEWILTQASFHCSEPQEVSLRKLNECVNTGTKHGQLGPIDRSLAARFFALKKLPLGAITALINLVEEIKTTSDLSLEESERLAHLIFAMESDKSFSSLLERLQNSYYRILSLPCTPNEFMAYVTETQSRLLGMGLKCFSERLRSALERGLSPTEFSRELTER